MQGLYEERHPHTHSSVQSDRDMGEEGGKERTRRMDVWTLDGRKLFFTCCSLIIKVTYDSVAAKLEEEEKKRRRRGEEEEKKRRITITCCSLRGITNCLVRNGEGGRKDLGVTVV